MPRTHWTPSPCGRPSRPPWWRVTATTTTDPPPRPGGHSGRCACPEPTNRVRRAPPGRFPRSLIRRSAGSASSYTPGASPRATATRRAASPARTVTGRTRRSPRVTRTEHPKQPIAASFGADDTYRGFDHWYRLPYAFLPCYRTRSAGGGPLLDCRGPLAAQHRTSGVGAALQLHPTVTAAGGEVSHPARSYGASRRRAPYVRGCRANRGGPRILVTVAKRAVRIATLHSRSAVGLRRFRGWPS